MNKRVRGRRRKQRQMQRTLVIAGLCAAALLVIYLIAYLITAGAVNKVDADKIWNNVYIEDISVSGMTAQEAKEVLTEQLEKTKEQTVTLRAEEAETKLTFEELGLQIKDIDKLVKKAVDYGKKGSVWARKKEVNALKKEAQNFEATYTVDVKKAEKAITEKMPELENAAKEATIKRENGQFIITEGKAGKKIDLKESVKIIEDYFNNEWDGGSVKNIKLVTTLDEPKITKEQLEQITDTLGTYSTFFGRGKTNREKNIINATNRINGALLMPGEELSASEAMGENTAENGYFAAGSYLDGEVVQSMGGGVCQVSTTLYNAVLMAELEITERFAHSMTVGYVKASMDAAIAEGYKDLKFKNNTDTPIYIEGIIKNGNVVFTVYGKETRDANRKVSYVSEVTSTTPGKKKYVASNDAVGVFKVSVEGHNAVKAKLWKIVTENGVEVSKTAINNSNYQSSTTTYAVGTNTTNAQAKKVLTDAIASQNEAKIKAAITQAKQIIADASKPVVNPTPTPTPGTGSQTPSNGTSGTEGQ